MQGVAKQAEGGEEGDGEAGSWLVACFEGRETEMDEQCNGINPSAFTACMEMTPDDGIPYVHAAL